MNLRLLWTGCDYMEVVAAKQVSDFPEAKDKSRELSKKLKKACRVVASSTDSLFLLVPDSDLALCLTRRKYEV
jgi:hypothetical protein